MVRCAAPPREGRVALPISLPLHWGRTGGGPTSSLPPEGWTMPSDSDRASVSEQASLSISPGAIPSLPGRPTSFNLPGPLEDILGRTAALIGIPKDEALMRAIILFALASGHVKEGGKVIGMADSGEHMDATFDFF